MRLQATLIKNVPDGFALSRGRTDWDYLVEFVVDFRKPMHAVLEWTFARADGRPQHGREHRTQAREVAHHTSVDDAFQHRQFAAIKQRLDYFPVRAIPAD